MDQTKAFNPNVKDGRRTNGLAIDKSNWSNTLDEPPFEAYAVTCGITFTIAGRQAGQFAAESAPPVAFGLPAQWGGSEIRISGPAADLVRRPKRT